MYINRAKGNDYMYFINFKAVRSIHKYVSTVCVGGGTLPFGVHLLFFQPGYDMQNQVAFFPASYKVEVTVAFEIFCSLLLSLPVHAPLGESLDPRFLVD